jgi:hypothetical protein
MLLYNYPSFSQRLSQNLNEIKLLFQETIKRLSAFDLSLIMTLLLLVFHVGHPGYLGLPITTLSLAAILYAPLRRSKIYWLSIILVVALANYRNWYSIDNHQHLIGYWCLAIFLALFTTDPEKSTATSARLLIGLAFLFATLWKAISGDYLEGAFFHYSLLEDERFGFVAKYLGGLTDEIILANYQAMQRLLAPDSSLVMIQLQGSPWISVIAQFLTWWTILIEGVIATAFLWPKDKWISKWRDILLFLFLLTTYAVTPVIGFGWILIAMGAAQYTSTFRYTPLGYLSIFLVLHIYYYVVEVNPFF